MSSQTFVEMSIVNWVPFAKGLTEANKRALQFMRGEMKRGANRIRTRVTFPGGATKVSFQPLSWGDGGSGPPVRKSRATSRA